MGYTVALTPALRTGRGYVVPAWGDAGRLLCGIHGNSGFPRSLRFGTIRHDWHWIRSTCEARLDWTKRRNRGDWSLPSLLPLPYPFFLSAPPFRRVL